MKIAGAPWRRDRRESGRNDARDWFVSDSGAGGTRNHTFRRLLRPLSRQRQKAGSLQLMGRNNSEEKVEAATIGGASTYYSRGDS
jgi:hypothetical protein